MVVAVPPRAIARVPVTRLDALVPTQELPIAKQPAVAFMPLVKVEVAVPITSRRIAVVEPVVPLSVSMEPVVVAKVVGDDVEKERMLVIARRLNGACVADASVRVSCGPVEDAIVSWPERGVVVPIPNRPFAANLPRSTGEAVPPVVLNVMYEAVPNAPIFRLSSEAYRYASFAVVNGAPPPPELFIPKLT